MTTAMKLVLVIKIDSDVGFRFTKGEKKRKSEERGQ